MPAINFPTSMSHDFSCPEPPPFDIPAGISSPYQSHIIHDTLTTLEKSIHKHDTGLEHILTGTCMQTLYASASQNEEHLTNCK